MEVHWSGSYSMIPSTKKMDMKKVLIVLFFLNYGFTIKAQYHLPYSSADTISQMLEEADFRFRQKKYEESNAIYWRLSKIDSLKAMSVYKIAMNDIFAEEYDSSFYHLNLAMKCGHENPVRAEIVANSVDYLYSSARDYAEEKGLENIEIA
jgi:hypothetical protein